MVYFVNKVVKRVLMYWLAIIINVSYLFPATKDKKCIANFKCFFNIY